MRLIRLFPLPTLLYLSRFSTILQHTYAVLETGKERERRVKEREGDGGRNSTYMGTSLYKKSLVMAMDMTAVHTVIKACLTFEKAV